MANDLAHGEPWLERIRRRAARRPLARDLSVALLIKCLLLAALYDTLAARSEDSGRHPGSTAVARVLLGHPASSEENRHDR
ncbi:hypothetical protein [Trinickia symbiotica]|uniref:hypothetical protein n=1 Tax=Trinickia symbiotica TaxID=863227 RepID=UPI0011B1F3A0|nr:hypothetical protein [Trinickia symbiotica]